jgi:hypothetical protein
MKATLAILVVAVASAVLPGGCRGTSREPGMQMQGPSHPGAARVDRYGPGVTPYDQLWREAYTDDRVN